MTTREQLVEKCKRLVDEYAHHFAVVAQLDDAPHYKPQRKELDDATAAAYAAIEELAASLPSHPDLRAFDAAVADEMALVSSLHDDSHAVCTLFAANVRERIAASPEAPAPPKYTEEWCMRMAALESQSDSEVDVGAPAPQGVRLTASQARASIKAAISLAEHLGTVLDRIDADLAASPSPPAAPQGVQVEPQEPKDHEIRELVNNLTKVAREHQGTQQLRERIAGLVVPFARGVALTAPPSPAAPRGGPQSSPTSTPFLRQPGDWTKPIGPPFATPPAAPQGVQAGGLATAIDAARDALPMVGEPESVTCCIDAPHLRMLLDAATALAEHLGLVLDRIDADLAAPPSPPAVQPQPGPSWTLTFNTPSKYIALYMVLNSERLCAFRDEAVANGIEYTDVVVELDGVATSFTLGEFARRLGIGAPSADPAVSPDDGGIEDDLYRLRRYIEGKSIYGRPYALDWLSNIERALARPAVSPDVQELVEAARESLGLMCDMTDSIRRTDRVTHLEVRLRAALSKYGSRQ